MSDVGIRPAVSTDQAIIRQMVRGERLDPSELDWSHFVVAEVDGEIIGIGQIRPYPNCRELGSLVVKREHRRFGIGEKLITALLAGETGDVYLETHIKNEAYYGRFGFRRISFRQAPRPLNIKIAVASVLRLFGIRIIAMKRDKTH